MWRPPLNSPLPFSERDDQLRVELDSHLRDADRLLMQILQTSLSLIGLGFTINVFVTEFASRSGLAHADITARRLGLAMLTLGILFLAMGLNSQASYRGELVRRYPLPPGWRGGSLRKQITPAFVTALLLLMIGLTALGSILFRNFK